MSKALYLMRHGQTRFNAQHRIQGSCDSPLTELGIEQALEAKAYFEKEQIDFGEVYASTQERACDTAELVSGRSDIIRLKGLKEWDFGDFEALQEFLNPPLLPGGLGYGDYFAAHGGESNEQVRNRMETAIRDLLEKTEAETILAVSHGGAISQFYRRVLENYPNIRLTNCAILKFSYDAPRFSLLYAYDPLEKAFLYQKDTGTL